MLTPAVYRERFAAAANITDYLRLAKPGELPGWQSAMARPRLTPAQASLVASFARRINVLVISGTWCGDCVQQVPILAAIAAASPANDSLGPASPGVDLRLLERDSNREFAAHFQICGGFRVPTAIFLNEDFDFVSLLGDRTLSRYRSIAARSLGPSCPLPGAALPADELAATTQDWLNEFERVALVLRLSHKLRERHGD